jgi:hypothetical protein
MNNKSLIIMVIALLGCGGHSDSPETAKGETKIRYVICRAGGTDCFVAARFKDMDSCESHKQLDEMLCDRRSDPGKIICKKDTDQNVAVAYCTL